MITVLTGTPGAGKSAQLVAWLLEYEKEGRPIYVAGVPDLDIKHEVMGDPEKWHEPGQVPDGALLVFDEAQKLWRPRPSGSKVPPHIEALETHRHRGIDWIIVTQGPNLIDANVRALVGRHVHLIDMGILGRRWYEWPHIADPLTYKSAPTKKSYKLPKHVFGKYKSASIHNKARRSIPPAVFVAGGAFVALAVLAVVAWQSISAKVAPAKPADVAAAPGPAASAAGFVRAPMPARAGQIWRPATEDPYDGLGMHLVGHVGDQVMVSVTLPHAGNRPIQYLSSAQLLRAGYTIRIDAPCSARLTHGTVTRRITCDQPAYGAGQGRAAPLPVAAPASGPGLV